MNFAPFVLLACAFATQAICEFSMAIGQKLQLIDDPRSKAHGNHLNPTPLVGGLAVVLPWCLAVLALHLSGYFDGPPGAPVLELQNAILILAFLFIGALDDRLGLSVLFRLVIKAVLYTALVLSTSAFTISQLYIPDLGIAWDIEFLALPLTVLCFVALNNAVNMCDGRNGLVIGMVFIWLAALLFRIDALEDPLFFMLPILLMIAGWYNLRGKLFLGDAGSYALSTLVGMLAIWAHGLPTALGGLTSTQLATFFAIPALDMLRVICTRLLRGAPMTAPDRDHLHHRLDRAVGWRLGLPIYLLSVALPLLVGLRTATSGLIGLSVAAVGYALLWYFTRVQAIVSKGTGLTEGGERA